MAGKSSGAGALGPDDDTPVEAHLLVIEARYYDKVADLLLEGAKAEMRARGVTFEVVTVPGALEIPQVLALAASNGLISSASYDDPTYDGAVALGCVIRGETSHYDIVCEQSNHWLNQVATADAIPVGNAILTVETEAQAVARAEGGRRGKGADAVRACLTLIQVAGKFEAAAGGELDEAGS
jgi:6,7-dimethyl-8-ribityllumazine synthase